MALLNLLYVYWRLYGALPGIDPYLPALTLRMEADMAKKVEVTSADVKALKRLAAEFKIVNAEATLDPCATWTLVRPYWPLITRLVTLIPRVGKQISAALVTIGTTLDTLCPILDA